MVWVTIVAVLTTKNKLHKYVSVISLAAQRAEIRNLASALAEQNEELERLKEDLADMSRVPVHPQYFHLPGQLIENDTMY